MNRLFVALILVVPLAGCSSRSENARPAVATTTSYLECAVQDIAGGEWDVVRLLPPGCCPGHFDVSPSMLDSLARSRLLIRFEFQSSLDERLRHFCDRGLRIAAVPSPDGLSVPSTYAEVCRGVCRALCDAAPGRADDYRRRLSDIEKRMETLADEAKASIARSGLAGARVLASGHQAYFCRAVGLDVVATFTGREAAGLKELEACLAAGKDANVRLVVANVQEGAQLATPLAEHLRAKVVVLSNFPSMQGDETTFDALLRRNLAALSKCAEEVAP